MEFNQFKFSEKHDSFRTLINVYNYNTDDIEIYVRADYKIIVSDSKEEESINVPERIKIKEVLVHYVNESIIMIELKLKDLEIPVKWK